MDQPDPDATELRPRDGSRTEADDLPETIGRYRVLSRLGEGGMGIVYEAEQQQPRRRVALKVVRGGFVDASRVRLFQREAEALARLRHPNIAAIHEAGRTDEGQHFFAMELVRGRTLDVFLRDRPRPVTRAEVEHRLRLFRQVCDAVHYAHQRGVIHRDLKPSNVVVDDQVALGVKILDFGLARITDGDVQAATMSVEAGLIRGTLAYMSPEQARGDADAIDVRSDVYALGVMLYEMLAESRPYDLSNCPLPVAVRIVTEQPPSPLRPAGSTTSGRSFGRDLETVVFKALEKEPDRRYASAAALSDDVERYLESQPIVARPPSTIYQLTKFAARHRALVVAAASVVVVLVAGVLVSTTFAIREARQRRQLERTRADLERVVDFQSRMLAQVDPQRMGRQLAEDLRLQVDKQGPNEAQALDRALRGVNLTDTAVGLLDEHVLEPAAQAAGQQFGDQPLIEGRLRRTLADSYYALGRFGRFEQEARRALELRERALGPSHADTLDARAAVARALHEQGRLEEAVKLEREIAAAWERARGPDDRETLFAHERLGASLKEWGRHDEALAVLEPAYATAQRVLGENDGDTMELSTALGTAYLHEGKLDQAEKLFERALEWYRRMRGAGDPSTINLTNNLANVYNDQERYSDAERLFREATESARSALGSDHPSTLTLEGQLASALSGLGRDDEAIALQLSALEGQRRVLGPDHPQSLISEHNLSQHYMGVGRLPECEALLRRVIDARARVLGEGNPTRLRSMRALATVLERMGRPAEAETVLKSALAAASGTSLGEQGREAMFAANDLLAMLFGQGRFAEALTGSHQLVERKQALFGDEAPTTLLSIGNHVQLALELGRVDEAEPLLERWLETTRRVRGPADPVTLEMMASRARVLAARGRDAEAEQLFHETIDIAARANGEGNRVAVETEYALVRHLASRARNDEALALLRTVVDHGYVPPGLLRDPELASLRRDPRFITVRAEAERRSKQR